jgi:hypothetical protein
MHNTSWKTKDYITTWEEFNNAIHFADIPLFKRLNEFPDSVLVTGCQRSGTTMLARIITQSDGMVNYWFGPDDELDAALILSGYVNHEPQGRYCFQTTYINNIEEYNDLPNGIKIIWSLRNPYSVVYSMLYNWGDNSMNRVFTHCGVPLLRGKDKYLYKIWGLRGISRLRRACLAYNGKTSQIFDLKRIVNGDSLLVIDYDELVKNRELHLQAIYSFINLKFESKYVELINKKSVTKRSKLSPSEVELISQLCNPIYMKSRDFLSDLNIYL